MYLKSLTLKGFKSFADRTKIALEPGVTVVVGPNGSGKSNITDAVLWVLGEQSAKSLRGQSMEDVIFAGSSARKSVGMAEVDLVLDNSDNVLPLEFDEITITRRMFRSGESEYLLNQSPARLMDIQDLLSDSGLGRDTHSIISQGRLDEILNSKPEDRRVLVEEAAGIRKHRKRKERALRKLGSMDGHVDALRHVLREVERQLRPLERQAERARKHDDLASELKDVDLRLLVDDLQGLQTQWDDIVASEKEHDAELEVLRARLAERERELEKFQSLLEEKGLFAGDLSEQRRRMQAILERFNSGLLLLEEKGKNLVDRLSDLRAKVHHSETRIAARREEIARIAEDRGKTDTELQAHYSRLSELRREGEATRKRRLAAEEQLTAAESELRRLRKSLDDDRVELSVFDNAMSAATFEEDLLKDRLGALDSRRDSVAQTMNSRRARVEQLDRAVARTKKEIALADADVDKRLRVLEDRRAAVAACREEFNSLGAELLALAEVQRAFEGATPALAWALSKEGKKSGIRGALSEAMTVEAGYERPVESALGADLLGVLVDDSASAIALADALTANEAGDVSLLPLRSAPEPPLGDLPGESLLRRVSTEGSASGMLAALIGDVRLLPDLASAIEAASSHPGIRAVTPEGHVAWPSGKVTLGPASDTSSGVLSRKRRFNELSDAKEGSEARLGDAEATVASAEEAVEAAQQDALELGQRLAAQSGELESLREETGRLEQSVTDIDAERDEIMARLAELVDRIQKDKPSRIDCLARIADARQRLEEVDAEVARLRDERDARYREEAQSSTKLSECQADIATVSEREVFLKRQFSSASADIDELDRSLRQAREVEAALELLRERIHPLHELYTDLLEVAEGWAHKLKDRAVLEQSDSHSLRDTIHEAQAAVREIQTEIEEAGEEVSTLRVEKGQLEVQVNQAVARIVEGMGVPLEVALQSASIDDRSALEDRAHSLRKKIANLGPVNPVAVEEYAALEERRDFLSSQLEDLLASKKSLQKVIAAIDRKMKDRFMEAFELIDKHFQEVFAVLFPGGHASLELTDPEDLGETGVEVVAQPRGKKLSRMSLMSGGEKALVALALLFALYHTRPCPFYVLDEVEAALDDVNLRRFIGLVDVLRSKTQFVVVTHQRRTMEMADLLYGVSMHADGVSKVVSQRIEQAVQSASKNESDEHAMV